MDVIELARELGRELQKDERYLNARIASANCDDDQELQTLIGEFNLKRMAIQNESQKDEQDTAKINTLNEEMRHTYAQVMQNANMTAYNQAAEGLNKLLQRVNAIVSQSADGENPDTADYEEHSCGGNCGSCGGCH